MRSDSRVEQRPAVSAQESVNVLRQAASRTGRTRSEESWIDIASQPSTSSLSSAGEDIVTTGLRVQQNMASRRRRRLMPRQPSHLHQASGDISPLADNSSQEEYEESESEPDQVLTSSNEGLVMDTGQNTTSDDDDNDDNDDDENRTAVNYPIRRPQNAFTPRPNAFSHPPTSTTMRNASEPCPGSYFPQGPNANPEARPPHTRHSFSAQDNRQHTPFTAAAHYDAALRTSLSTLLSCAAALRGPPKVKSPATQPLTSAPASSTRIQPSTLRLVPESALPTFQPTIRPRSTTSTSPSASRDRSHHRRGRHGSSSSSSSSSKDRSRAKRTGRSGSAGSRVSAYSTDELLVSPTLLTWVVSAGVVVVLSAITFTAGYVVGREAGRVEGSWAVDGGGCAVEAGRVVGLEMRTSGAGAGGGMGRMRWVQA